MAMAGVFAMGINVTEGSKEGSELGESTKTPLSVLPMPSKMLNESETQKACEIVNTCRELILPALTGAIKDPASQTFFERVKKFWPLEILLTLTGIIKDPVSQMFFERVKKFGLLEKMDQQFEYKGRITTLKKELTFIINACKFLTGLKKSPNVGVWPKNKQEIMGMAVQFNNSDALLIALEMGADTKGKLLMDGERNGKSIKTYLSPLAVAIELHGETPKLAELLLKFGANPNAVCFDNLVPLALATFEGKREIVRTLLENGANPNKASQSNTALCFATGKNDTEMVSWLLEKGARPNVKGKNQFPIFDAVRHDNPEMLDLLVKHGADIEIFGPWGVTPLSCAILFKCEKSMNCLLTHEANIFGCFYRQGEGVPPAVRARFQKIYRAFFASPDEDDPDKIAQRAYAVKNLRCIHPMDRENGVLALIMHRANIGLIPCDLITDKVIKYWIINLVPVPGLFGMPMHFIDDVPLKAIIDLRSSMSEMPEGFPDVNREISKLPEEHRKKVEDFFERAKQEIEGSEKSEESKVVPSVSDKIGGGEIEYVTYLRPEPKGPRVKEVKSEITPVVDKIDVEKKEEKVKCFSEPYERIFQSCDRNTKIEGKTFDMLIKRIHKLCAFLTRAGFKCDLVLRNNHYVLELGTFPEWAEALRRYNLPNRLSVDHGDNDTYSIFFDSTFSYLVHALCLLAQSKGPLSEQALDKLKKYAEEERLLYPILEIYTELEPYFKPYFF